jgi:hypothetical protein
LRRCLSSGSYEVQANYGKVGPEADKVVFTFVTADPERDTPEVMRKYPSYYSDGIIGLYGNPDKVNAVLKLQSRDRICPVTRCFIERAKNHFYHPQALRADYGNEWLYCSKCGMAYRSDVCLHAGLN